MAKKKPIYLSEVGFEKTYCPALDTNDLASFGGHKIHIKNLDTGKCLCGYEDIFLNSIMFEDNFSNIIEYITQPDIEENMCKKCRNILIERLEVDPD